MLKTMLNAYQPPKRTPNNAVFFASWEISNDAAADTFTTFDFDDVVVLAIWRLKEDAAKSLLFPNKEEEEVNELDDDDLLSGEFIITIIFVVVLGRAQRHDRWLFFDPAKEEDERCVWWWVVVANMMTMMMKRRSVSSSHCGVCFVSGCLDKMEKEGKKQLSEYQRQCHVFLTNESLVRQEKSPHAQKTSRYQGM